MGISLRNRKDRPELEGKFMFGDTGRSLLVWRVAAVALPIQ